MQFKSLIFEMHLKNNCIMYKIFYFRLPWMSRTARCPLDKSKESLQRARRTRLMLRWRSHTIVHSAPESDVSLGIQPSYLEGDF